jgi:hypothetical protein
MTFGAGLIARGGDVNAASVFGVTLCAPQLFSADDTDRVVDWTIVACEAGRVCSPRGESAGLLHMASGAFFFENGVSFRHASARVHAMITRKSAPRDPNQCK